MSQRFQIYGRTEVIAVVSGKARGIGARKAGRYLFDRLRNLIYDWVWAGVAPVTRVVIPVRTGSAQYAEDLGRWMHRAMQRA